MFGIHNYAGFLTAIMLYQLAPGAGTLAILHATARGGRRGGMGAVLGLLARDLVFMLAAVSGVAALLAATPFLFSLLQWGGILYLEEENEGAGLDLDICKFQHVLCCLPRPQPTEALTGTT